MGGQLVKVVIADDHAVIRLGIELALSESPMLSLVGACANSTELMQLLDVCPCDVLVTDYAMPGGEHGDGLELLESLRERYPKLGIVVMTAMDRPVIVQSIIALGVINVVSKADDMHHLKAAVLAAYAHRGYLSPSLAAIVDSSDPIGQDARSGKLLSSLSPREYQVLSLYVRGATINDIAALLNRSKQTISSQKVRAMAKLGMKSEADLFKHAGELGLR